MNFPPWNIVRKDFRLTRPFLLAWWGILAVSARLTVWNLNKIMQDPSLFQQDAHRGFILDYDPFFAREISYASNWLFMGLDLVLLTVIVDMIVKADSPIDERAVWRTRPVSGLGVWRAKLLYLALFCYLVPGLIQTIQFVSLGSDWRYCLEGLARFVVLQSLLVAIVASAAVLFQRTFSGLLVFCGVALAFLLLGQTDIFSYIIPDNAVSPFHNGLPTAWIVLGLLSLTGLGVGALIYAGRARKVSALALGGGVLAAIAAYFIGTFYLHALPATPQLDNRVQAAFDAHPVSGIGGGRANGNLDRLELSASISLRGASDTVLQMNEISSHLSWPGTKLPPVKTDYSILQLFNLTNALATAGYGRLLGNKGPSYPATTLVLTKAELAQIAGQPARWQGTFTGEIGHLVVDWDVSLPKIARLSKPAQASTVDYGTALIGATLAHNQSLYDVESSSRLNGQSLGELGFDLWSASPTNLLWMNLPPTEEQPRILLLFNPAKKQAMLNGVVSYGNSASTRESLSIYSINSHYAEFNLAEIFGDKYPIQPDGPILNKLYANGDTVATRAYIQTWQRDRNAFLVQHSQEMSLWLADARLVELHFVPDHPVYNTATIDLPQIITPDVARGVGIAPP